jgi:hypothetical protein
VPIWAGNVGYAAVPAPTEAAGDIPVIWATLALLGIPIWFIAVILVAAFRNRNVVRSNPDEFDYKLKKGDKWQRKKGYARWVSDVLIFHAGIALIRSSAVQVEAVAILDTIQLPSSGLGDNPTGLLVTYAGGETATIAVSAQNLDAALGPTKDSTS